jgi:formylglycine-generating enzyme required for sulfatase activity
MRILSVGRVVAVASLLTLVAGAHNVVWTRSGVAAPLPCAGNDMVFDRQRGCIWIYEGQGQLWQLKGDTWTLVDSNGPPLTNYAMAFDEARGEPVIFGGTTAAGTLSRLTWAWDGTKWYVRSETGPTARRNAAMVYDPVRGEVLVIGGYDGEIKSDTWALKGETWTERATSGPPAGDHHRVVFDRGRGVVVLFGGTTWCSGTVFGETWEWDGNAWLLRSTAGPDPRFLHGMAYHEGLGVTFLFGGLLSGECSPPRNWAEAVTWTWDGTKWSALTLAGPSQRHYHRAVYDALRNRVVLVGGVAGPSGELLNDTWHLVIPPVGDMNCDGVVDFKDINPFVLAIQSKPLYEAAYPGCDWRNGDCNGDGWVDFRDINCFVARMTTPAPAGMVPIPGGPFEMGDPFNEGQGDERPVHSVSISPYYMDTKGVTNQQYVAWLNAAMARNLITVINGAVYKTNSGTDYPYCDTNTSHLYSQITWDGSTFGVETGKANNPAVMVTWYGAVAYCNWRSEQDGRPQCYDLSTWECNYHMGGYRLPTEAEWEKAARGGAPGQRFPWPDTDTIQHAPANYVSLPDYPYDTSPTRGYHPAYNTGSFPYTSPVGSFAPNSYGLYDMAGNVWQWCNDWHTSTYYAESPAVDPTGPPRPVSGQYRIIRGGGWWYSAYECRVANRHGAGAGNLDSNIGFRCVTRIP